MAIAALATVAVAITGSVLLAVSSVEHGVIVAVIGATTLLRFALLWFGLPLADRSETGG